MMKISTSMDRLLGGRERPRDNYNTIPNENETSQTLDERDSMVVFVNAIIGPGVVALPKLYQVSGWLFPTILLTAASGLMFGLTVGWPRSRVVSNVIMLFVFSIFGGLWLLPMFGLAEQHVAYVVVGGTLGLTFLVAPTVFGMMVRGVVRDGEGEASEERA